MKSFKAGFVGCISLSLIPLYCQGAAPKKNVLFIMADDFNFWASAIGYYPQSYTPNIDALASKGVLFTEAHCSSPVSNPSRNALWSGYRPVTTGIDNNSGGFVRDVTGFANITTLHQYFKQNGYHVYAAGKLWHPGRMDPSNPDCDPANWSQLNTQATGCNGGTYSRWEATSDNSFIWSGNTNVMTESNCNDYAMGKQVASFLSNYSTSANKDKPFFIGCGFFRPHLPFNSPVQFWNLFGQDTLNIPKGYLANDLSDIPGANTAAIHTEIVANNKWKEGIRAYLASMALADFNVGLLLTALENSPYKDNTIVLFMGDHGWHLGEKDRWSKYAVYDQANHTTMVIYDPSAKANGQKCTKVVSLQDLYPTLVELCGLPPKTDIEGRSLQPLLENPGRADWTWPILMTYSGTTYIKTNSYRFVDNGTSSQLYQVTTDPYEWTNLYSNPSYSGVLTRLRGQIDSIKKIGAGLKAKLLAGYQFVPQPKVIPGIIEAEDYDEGSEGQVYHDSDPANTGGQYRLLDGVDIEITSDVTGAFNITSTANGEWMIYTISGFEAGDYDITARVCNPGITNSTLSFYLENNLIGQVTVPSGTPDWSDITLSKKAIDGSGFIHLKVLLTGGGAKINSYNFVKTTTVSADLIIKDDGKHRLLINNRLESNILQLDLTPTNPTAKIEIFNLYGVKLEESYLTGESITYYTIRHNLDPGYYFVRISDGVLNNVEKFLKF